MCADEFVTPPAALVLTLCGLRSDTTAARGDTRETEGSHSVIKASWPRARTLLSKGHSMSAYQKKLRPVRPDEWGIYDPQKAGVAAVLERLAARRGVNRQKSSGRRTTSRRKTQR